ncbi:response regulator containing a cheY-like receiver [Caudoviricetes sp.]|nr:response regulator containing a cheY-like receiver [Caudoviricetes sp.]UOF79103.1 response regulator containing a cheY-like receiver [Caudoviricetes sp.]
MTTTLPTGKENLDALDIAKLRRKSLSNREVEVANMVYKGMSNREIANALFITEKTVKFHVTHIFKKYKLRSRAQLIVKMIELEKADNEK